MTAEEMIAALVKAAESKGHWRPVGESDFDYLKRLVESGGM